MGVPKQLHEPAVMVVDPTDFVSLVPVAPLLACGVGPCKHRRRTIRVEAGDRERRALWGDDEDLRRRAHPLRRLEAVGGVEVHGCAVDLVEHVDHDTF